MDGWMDGLTDRCWLRCWSEAGRKELVSSEQSRRHTGQGEKERKRDLKIGKREERRGEARRGQARPGKMLMLDDRSRSVWSCRFLDCAGEEAGASAQGRRSSSRSMDEEKRSNDDGNNRGVERGECIFFNASDGDPADVIDTDLLNDAFLKGCDWTP